jgi:hypothetical protein
LQVATDIGFTSVVFDDSTITDTLRQVGPFAESTTFYWRVNARNAGGSTPFSTPSTFTTPTVSALHVYSVSGGWNLISLPLTVSDPRTSTLFPTATSTAFAFIPATGYQTRDSLLNGAGYWLRFSSSENVNISGSTLLADTIPVEAGWNLIGSISSSVDTAAITTIPTGIRVSPFYGYADGYLVVDSVSSGGAYWVKFTQAGSVVLSSTSAVKRAMSDHAPAQDRPKNSAVRPGESE